MKKIIINLLIIIILTITVQISWSQSPWVRSPKKAYLQLGASAVTYNRVVINDKVITTNRSNYDITTQFYAEYGLFKNTELNAILPYKLLGYKNPVTKGNEVLNGLGNIQVGLKHMLMDKNYKLSAGVFTNLNTGSENQINGLRTGFRSNTVQPYLTLGTSKNGMYFYVLGGYGIMDNKHADFLRIAGEIGKAITPKMHLIVCTELRKSINYGEFGKTDAVLFSENGLYLDEQQYLTFGLKANYEFIPGKMGATISAYGAAYVRNVAAGPAINLSFYRKI
ncbi:MAG: hypothetical protein ACOYOA_04205 [Saprospiraceae bacterium]